MKRTKRLISLFLAIIMLLGSVVFSPRPVQAQGEETEPPQWVKDQITKDLDTNLKEPGSVKFYEPIIEEDDEIANKWTAKLLVAARDSKQTSDIVLVIDTSGSMNEKGRMKAAKDAAKAFVEKLLPSSTTKIAVVNFADTAEQKTSLTNNVNTLNAAINKLSDDGGTFTQGGIHEARKILKKSTANNKYIVVLSDGVPTYSYEIKNKSYQENDTNVDEKSYNYSRRVGDGKSMEYNAGWLLDPKLYNHGNSAIAEAGFAKNTDKIEVFSIGLQTETVGSGVLKQMAYDESHFKEVTDVNQLTPVFKQIAGAIAVAAKDASANPTTSQGFQYAFELIEDGKVKTSPGSKAVIKDGKLNWTMEKVQTVYDQKDPSIKYEYLTFEFELNDDILKNQNQSNVAPLEGLTFTYTDAEGNSQSKTAESPKVNPIIVSVTKKVTDNDGGAAVDIDQREFTFIAKDSAENELKPITLKHDQSKILKNMKKGQSYTVYESAKGKAYNEAGTEYKEFNVADYYNKFITTLNGTPSQTDAAPDGIGKSATTSAIPQNSQNPIDKQELVFTNTEDANPKAKVTLTKLIENKTGQTVTPSGDKEFKITFAKKGITDFSRPGDKVEFTVKEGESNSKTMSGMRFTTYLVTEDLNSAKPYTPKDKEQNKEVKVTLYDVLAGEAKGQEVSFTNVFDPDKKIDFTAEKKWEVPTGRTLKDADYPTMNFTLYRKVKDGNEEAVQNSVKITKTTTTAEWKNLDAFDTKGNEYTYSVKETFKTEDVKNDNWITGKMVTEDGKNTITNKLKEVAKPGENPDPDKNPVGKLTIKKELQS